MAGCGYVCPQCDGNGFDESGDVCNWCSPIVKSDSKPIIEISDEEWIEKVHGACSCSDIGEK